MMSFEDKVSKAEKQLLVDIVFIRLKFYRRRQKKGIDVSYLLRYERFKALRGCK